MIGAWTTDFGKLLKLVWFARVNNPCWGPIHALHTGNHCVASIPGTSPIQVNVLDVVFPKLKLPDECQELQPTYGSSGTETSLTTAISSSPSLCLLHPPLCNAHKFFPSPQGSAALPDPSSPARDLFVCNWRNQMVFYQVNNPWKGRVQN